jgi:hypothetical protein
MRVDGTLNVIETRARRRFHDGAAGAIIAVFRELGSVVTVEPKWSLEGVFPSRAVFKVAARHETRCEWAAVGAASQLWILALEHELCSFTDASPLRQEWPLRREHNYRFRLPLRKGNE